MASPHHLICFLFLLVVGCVSLPERTDEGGVRDFYLHTMRDPECAVASERTLAGDPHRIFRIASLGKLFVEVALCRMSGCFVRVHASSKKRTLEPERDMGRR